MSRETIIKAKEDAVKEIVEKMKEAQSVVVAEYRGLTVEKTQDLRTRLRDAGCEMIVVKNNISRRAAEKVGLENLDDDVLTGPNSLVFAYEDGVSAAKTLYEFARKNPKLVLKSGYVNGNFYEPAIIKEIATIPPRDTLLAMLGSQLLAPVRDLAIGLDMMVNEEDNEENDTSEESEE